MTKQVSGAFFSNTTIDGVPLNMSAFLNDRGVSCDSGQVLAAAEALKAVAATLFEKPFPPLKSGILIPRKFDAGAWATRTSFITVEGRAEMKPVGGLAEDLKEASFGIDEDVSPVREFGTAYGFGRKELIYAAKLGLPLENTKARLCLQAYETLVDKLAAYGDARLKLQGILSNTLIPREISTVSIDAGSANTIILGLLNEIAGRIADRTDEAATGNTMVMPLKQRDYIANTPFNDAGDGRSILEVFLQNNEYIERVVSWNRFKAKGGSVKGKGNRHVIGVWSPDDMVLRQQIPEPFLPLDPQMQGTRTVVNCVASIGSVEVIKPKEIQLYEIPNND